MRRPVATNAEIEPLPRLVLDRRRLVLRVVGVGLVAFTIGLAFALPPPVAALMVSASLLAMAIERLAVRAEAAETVQVVARAARSEGQRDAVAQVMSLELAHERSRSVLEALREGVLVVDTAGEIVLANPAARRAMRMPMQAPEGQLLWEALMPELGQRAREAWQALREQPVLADELPQIRYAAIPCRDAVYDLTAVEATSRRTGQDFGSVFLLVDSTRAHELRTPLTNICAYAEILRNMVPGESAEWPEFVRVIHEEGLQLSHLVDAMFDYLQLESGEAKFANDTVDGASIVRDCVQRKQAAAGKRCIDLQLELHGEAPALLGDAPRLQQVVTSLLDNAVKFTPTGGKVRVGLGVRDEGWELRIEDSGPGVPPDDRRAVFEKFHQLRDHLTDKPQGTGLGLATSRAIVARLGGLIWCEDSPLGGAGFVVLLPGFGQPRLAAVGAGTGAGGGF